MEKNLKYTTIDEYIAQFSAKAQQRLKAIRKRIARLAPDATEKISYQMPPFYLNGNLLHSAGSRITGGLSNSWMASCAAPKESETTSEQTDATLQPFFF